MKSELWLEATGKMLLDIFKKRGEAKGREQKTSLLNSLKET